MKKKTTCFNKLTPFEKEALLYAMLQIHDPSEAIHTIFKDHNSLHIRWDGYKKVIIPEMKYKTLHV
jgi:hypothetical protein